MIVREIKTEDSRMWIVKGTTSVMFVIMYEGDLYFLESVEQGKLTLFDLGADEE